MISGGVDLWRKVSLFVIEKKSAQNELKILVEKFSVARNIDVARIFDWGPQTTNHMQ